MIRVHNATKIHEIRAIHALSDLNIKLVLSKGENDKFILLKKVFNMPYSITSEGEFIDHKELIKIDHSLPKTSILSVSKTLIFSEKILDYLKSKWTKNKKIEFSYCGMITDKRKNTLQHWINLGNNGEKYTLENETLLFRAKRKIYGKLNIDGLLTRKYKNVHIRSSIKGREFPKKTWDKSYYKFLLKSKFVLCPSGDYVWTYRFFEAILCGAIPVVEEKCPAYDGYLFYMMNEPKESIKYNNHIITHNYNLLKERITLSDTEKTFLEKEINILAQ